jgi:hypothetical protein
LSQSFNPLYIKIAEEAEVDAENNVSRIHMGCPEGFFSVVEAD